MLLVTTPALSQRSNSIFVKSDKQTESLLPNVTGFNLDGRNR